MFPKTRKMNGVRERGYPKQNLKLPPTSIFEHFCRPQNCLAAGGAGSAKLDTRFLFPSLSQINGRN